MMNIVPDILYCDSRVIPLSICLACLPDFNIENDCPHNMKIH